MKIILVFAALLVVPGFLIAAACLFASARPPGEAGAPASPTEWKPGHAQVVTAGSQPPVRLRRRHILPGLWIVTVIGAGGRARGYARTAGEATRLAARLLSHTS